MTKTPCPITADPAQIRARTADYTEFDCPQCGVFRISDAAMALAGDNPETLAEALAVARTAAGAATSATRHTSGALATGGTGPLDGVGSEWSASVFSLGGESTALWFGT